jgi:UDP-3-O-[3-hydroxymyristoyl] glucosamine N-acyltransferase
VGADQRFFERLGPRTASELAALAGATCIGDASAAVSDLAEPSRAGEGDAFFLTRETPPVGARGAVAISSNPDILEKAPELAAAIINADPKLAFAAAGHALYRLRALEEADGAGAPEIADTARLGPGVLLGADVRIGPDCDIGAGAVIGPGVEIGAGTRIGARAVIQCALIGSGCEIYSGVVIGEAGFGLTPGPEGLVTLPHFGRVIIEDDVVVGALCTIDRGMLADTVLRKNARIDNHCHIAHNVDVGASVIMAAFAGISGSVKIGPGAQFGGRVGVADHLSIGAGASLAADAAVMRDVPAGEVWAGSPAQPIRSFMRETAWIRRQVHGKASTRKKD